MAVVLLDQSGKMEEGVSGERLGFCEVREEFMRVQDGISDWACGWPNGTTYMEESWDYKPGEGSGGGRSRIWESENPSELLEKGGVNFSAIRGQSLPLYAGSHVFIGVQVLTSPRRCIYEQFMNSGNGHAESLHVQRANSDSARIPYCVTGVSLVFHPHNPHVPTIHMNVRYFETESAWWFGGGIDLTPYYLSADQVRNFHAALKKICERHDHSYEKYKSQCDAYFYLRHRKEARGVGGIFFDHLSGKNKRKLLDFVLDVAKSFPSIYEPLVAQNYKKPYAPRQREYQLFRRSRYVEFNLLWDRGTKFGIMSEGRTESILMSLPSICKWKYKENYPEDSVEGQINSFYLRPRDWLNLKVEDFPMALR